MKKVIVIGGGPGGYVAALRAAIMGAEVYLVEKQDLGGTCLNRGCIPTKAFLYGSDLLETVQNANKLGLVNATDISENLSEIYNRKDAVVKQLVGGVEFLLKKRGVQIIKGYGKLVDNRKVTVLRADGMDQILEADGIILATGSLPIIPTILQYDGERIFTSDEALAKKELLKSVIIVGGGVVGCEFGQFYARMGAKVTIVELAKHILPFEDEDSAQVLQKQLKKLGITFYIGSQIEQVDKNDTSVSAMLSTGERITADCMLLSVGRKANIESLGLEEVGVKIENGKVIVNNRMQTNMEGVYAIGDIVNTPLLAHVASREGVVAVENILSEKKTISYKAVPRCIYTDPEVAAVGLTEREAVERGIEFKKGIFKFSGIGKAMVTGKTDGFVKILVNENDIIIGGVIVGAHATELISELTMAVHVGLSAETAGEIIHAHPTFSEAIMEAFHDIRGHSVHAF